MATEEPTGDATSEAGESGGEVDSTTSVTTPIAVEEAIFAVDDGSTITINGHSIEETEQEL